MFSLKKYGVILELILTLSNSLFPMKYIFLLRIFADGYSIRKNDKYVCPNKCI